jgi:hypothetical protein
VIVGTPSLFAEHFVLPPPFYQLEALPDRTSELVSQIKRPSIAGEELGLVTGQEDFR